MKYSNTLAALLCVAALAGCAAIAPAPASLPAQPTMAALLAQADAAAAAKQDARAIAILKQATVAYPKDQSPWIKLAELSFNCENYGDAISYANKVTEHDGANVKALSILAVSGLRVSSQSLRDLAQQNNISGSVKLEAQQVAKVLRTSIGGDIIPAKNARLKPGNVKQPEEVSELDKVLYETSTRNGSTRK